MSDPSAASAFLAAVNPALSDVALDESAVAEAVLRSLRVAIHDEGEGPAAIRRALGLGVEGPKRLWADRGPTQAKFRRVIGEWIEVGT